MSEPKVIVLTALKNEEWIIHLFLQVMSQIADHIIVADQGSTDRTRSICGEFPKVILIDNDSPIYDERERQILLIETARKLFPGPRLLLTFDADDIPSANIFEESEWKAVLKASPGVPVLLQNVCLYGSPYEFRTNKANLWGVSYLPYAMIDNDAPHSGRTIHNPRLPFRRDEDPIRLKNVVSMHYQFVDLERAMAKQRWYLCHEHLNFPEKSLTDIIKTYRWAIWDVHTWSSKVSPSEWLVGWQQRGIDLADVTRSKYSWWTWEILRFFEQYSETTFANLPIWDFDWEAARKDGLAQGISGLPERVIRDPRSWRTRLTHYLLRKYGASRFFRLISNTPSEQKRAIPAWFKNVLHQFLPDSVYTSLWSAWHRVKQEKN